MNAKVRFSAFVLLLTGSAASNLGLPPPNSNCDRPGADMQANLGATIWNAATAMNMNAENNPPPLPPGLRDPKITDDERMNVNPLNEARGPDTPNVSVANHGPAAR